METREEYLGDGVYAAFDGWQIWLRTQRDSGVHEIALEPDVLSALTAYVERLKATAEPAEPQP